MAKWEIIEDNKFKKGNGGKSTASRAVAPKRTAAKAATNAAYTTTIDAADDRKDLVLKSLQNVSSDATSNFYKKYDKSNEVNAYVNDTNKIKLNTGRFTGTNVPSTLIDDLAEAANRNNIPVGQMLALAGRESAFGIPTKYSNYADKTEYVSGWNVADQYAPYNLYRFLADKKVPGIKTLKSTHGWIFMPEDEEKIIDYTKTHPELIDEYKSKIAKTLDVGDKNAYDLSAIQLKNKGIQSYNPSDPNYVKMFQKDYDSLKQDKNLMDYLQKKGYDYENVTPQESSQPVVLPTQKPGQSIALPPQFKIGGKVSGWEIIDDIPKAQKGLTIKTPFSNLTPTQPVQEKSVFKPIPTTVKPQYRSEGDYLNQVYGEDSGVQLPGQSNILRANQDAKPAYDVTKKDYSSYNKEIQEQKIDEQVAKFLKANPLPESKSDKADYIEKLSPYDRQLIQSSSFSNQFLPAFRQYENRVGENAKKYSIKEAFSDPNKLSEVTQSAPNRFRLFPNATNSIEDFVNPGIWLGQMEQGVADIPKNIRDENYLGAAMGVVNPLAMGALGSMGTKSTGQWLNNMANPLAGIVDANTVKGLGNKVLNNYGREAFTPVLDNVGVEALGANKPTIKNIEKSLPMPQSLSELSNTGFRNDPNYHLNAFNAKKKDILKHISSPEGRKRIQNYIDNNPHLQDKTVDKVIKDFNKTEFVTEAPVWENAIDDIDGSYGEGWATDEHGNKIFLPVDPNSAFNLYINGYNKPSVISMGQNYTPYDAQHILEHEFAHLFQRGAEVKGVDDELAHITTESSSPTLMGAPTKYNPLEKEYKDKGVSVTKDRFGYNDSYDAANKRQKMYWEEGKGIGQEKAAFAAEVRENLLQRGLIKDRYDKITPELLKKHYEMYHNTTGDKYNLRLYDIMDKNLNNFKILSSSLNKLPGVLPYIGYTGAGALTYKGLQGLGAKSKPQQQKHGGIIEDPMGQWAHPGSVTRIPSNQITMQGVNYPVLGVSDKGHTQMMYPGKDYSFKGKSVTEYPMMGSGGEVNFTYAGENHRVYEKVSPTGNGEGIEGHIMVNHPTEDKGKWDTIDLTKITNGKVKTVAQGVASTKKWHKENPEYADGGMIKRADGSYSKRGLWDNIRDNAGSGKKPTKEMLKQERKIKSQYANGGKVSSWEIIEDLPKAGNGLISEITSTLNPKNWGVKDYTKSGTRDQAYAAARKAGEKEFMWNNQRYNTLQAGEDKKPNTNFLNKAVADNITAYGFWDGGNDNVAPNKELAAINDKYNKLRIEANKKYNYFERTSKEQPRVPIPKELKEIYIKNKEEYIKEVSKIAYNVKTGEKIKLPKYINPDTYSKRVENAYEGNPTYFPSLRPDNINASQDALSIHQGQPQKYDSFESSKYIPTDAKNKNAKYYDFKGDAKQELEDDLFKYKNSDFINSKERFRQIKGSHVAQASLKDFQYSKGADDRGKYVAYYDVNDYGNILDLLPNSKPFDIYGRTYYKDYGKGNVKMYYSDKELSELDVNKKNFDTLALQRELSNRGYNLPKSTKPDGTFDGVLGDETKKALQDFQNKKVEAPKMAVQKPGQSEALPPQFQKGGSTSEVTSDSVNGTTYSRTGTLGMDRNRLQRTVTPYTTKRDIKKNTPIPTSGQDIDFNNNYFYYKNYFKPAGTWGGGDTRESRSVKTTPTVPFEGDKHWNSEQFMLKPHLTNDYPELHTQDNTVKQNKNNVLADMYKYQMLNNPDQSQGKSFRQAKKYMRQEINPKINGEFLNAYNDGLPTSARTSMNPMLYYGDENQIINYNNYNRTQNDNPGFYENYKTVDYNELKKISKDYFKNYEDLSRRDASKKWKSWEEKAAIDEQQYNDPEYIAYMKDKKERIANGTYTKPLPYVRSDGLSDDESFFKDNNLNFQPQVIPPAKKPEQSVSKPVIKKSNIKIVPGGYKNGGKTKKSNWQIIEY